MSSRPATAAAIPRRPARRRAGLPLIIGGAVLALLTFVGVIFYTSSAGTSVGGSAPVVVAAHDISIRVPIQPADLTVVQYHSTDVPPGAFSRITDLSNAVAAINISKGQPVTSNLVVSSTDTVIGPQSAFLPIPTGFVALTIPTGEQVGVAGYIHVGDYISLVAIVQGKTGTNARIVYTNIPVVRVGVATAAAAQGTATTPPTVGGLSTSLTVVVTQCQAEFIAWFLSNGSLRYTLESYHDYKPQDTAVDTACPDVNAAGGVTSVQVGNRWPGIFS